MRQKLLLVAAAFFGALAFILMYQQIKSEKEKALRGSIEVLLLAAKTDLIAGETLERENLAQIRDRRFSDRGSTEIKASDLDRVLGKKLAFNVKRGSVLLWQDVSGFEDKRQRGLTGIVAPGWRAISVAVDSTSSVTNQIRPNNHVDIIGTFKFPSMKDDKELDTITLTLLQDVTVLATGQELASALGSPVLQRGSAPGQRGYNTLTLSLSPKEVEMVIFAAQKGRLDFSLRNFEDSSTVGELPSVNFKYLESHLKDFAKERESLGK